MKTPGRTAETLEMARQINREAKENGAPQPPALNPKELATALELMRAGAVALGSWEALEAAVVLRPKLSPPH